MAPSDRGGRVCATTDVNCACSLLSPRTDGGFTAFKPTPSKLDVGGNAPTAVHLGRGTEDADLRVGRQALLRAEAHLPSPGELPPRQPSARVHLRGISKPQSVEGQAKEDQRGCVHESSRAVQGSQKLCTRERLPRLCLLPTHDWVKVRLGVRAGLGWGHAPPPGPRHSHTRRPSDSVAWRCRTLRGFPAR